MRERLVPEKYVKLVQDMYTGCRKKVRTVAGESSKYNVEVGLHQGSVLSPYLFLILMDMLTERVRKEAPESMLFADDIVLCGDKDVDMTEYLESWRKALEERGMRVSRPKTQFMEFFLSDRTPKETDHKYRFLVRKLKGSLTSSNWDEHRRGRRDGD